MRTLKLACGLKDEWPDYPCMEFMPALESGNGQNWNIHGKLLCFNRRRPSVKWKLRKSTQGGAFNASRIACCVRLFLSEHPRQQATS